MNHRRFAACLMPLAMLFAACVPVEELPPGLVPKAPVAASANAYPDLDAGSTSITSMHFTLKGYSEQDLKALSATAESIYNKIGNDTGLYTFLASGNYTLVVYKDSDEYHKKTQLPSWSQAINAGKANYLYPDPALEPVLAHMMVRMIFEDYMGDKATQYKWIEEGLAMNEELLRMPDSDRSVYQASKTTQLAQNHMPFSQMTFFIPNSEEKRRTDVWYQQVESVMTFLLAQGSALAFGQFMSELKSGGDIDHVLSDAYPARYRSLNDLEASWKSNVGL
jgi:hypothetical protein